MLLNKWVLICIRTYYLEQLYVKSILTSISFPLRSFVKYAVYSVQMCSLFQAIFSGTSTGLNYYSWRTIEWPWLGHCPQTWIHLKVLLLDSWENLVYLTVCLFYLVPWTRHKVKKRKREAKRAGWSRGKSSIKQHWYSKLMVKPPELITHMF